MHSVFETAPAPSAIPITFATKATWDAISADLPAPARAFALGLSSDPLSEEVACEGRFSVGDHLDQDRLPTSRDWQELCEATRRLPRD